MKALTEAGFKMMSSQLKSNSVPGRQGEAPERFHVVEYVFEK